MNIASMQKGSIASVVAILILTILEFPAPIGFETRPQDNVSLVWLAFFFVILVAELAVIPAMLKSLMLGWAKLGSWQQP